MYICVLKCEGYFETCLKTLEYNEKFWGEFVFFLNWPYHFCITFVSFR